MSARKKKHEEEEHENHERWLVSFADMMTLLMVLFIVLFAMATVDANKFDALKQSLAGHEEAARSILQGAPSVVDGGEIARMESSSQLPSVDIEVPRVPSKTNAGTANQALKEKQEKEAKKQEEDKRLEEIKKNIQASLTQAGLNEAVKFTKDSRGLTISIVTDQVLFDRGQATIRPEAHNILDALGPPLANTPNDISIEGFTDNTPIATSQFPSNWELSTARATSVLRYMVEKEGVSPARVGATGYGAERESVPNDSDAHRAQNRRVEIVVLSSVEN